MLSFSGIQRVSMAGGNAIVVANASFVTAYTTGGTTVNPADLGLRQIIAIWVPESNHGYLISYNRVSDSDHRLKVLLPTSTHVHDIDVAQTDVATMKVVYWQEASGGNPGAFVTYGSGATQVAQTDLNTSGVASEVPAGTDLSAIKNMTCIVLGY